MFEILGGLASLLQPMLIILVCVEIFLDELEKTVASE
tara:strand:+ start:142 stop:252 length:111 start_codon:yes stop_codon:yes gene_type:complete